MTKKLYIKTYGCQMNVYDSMRMGDVLAPFGYVESDSPEGADLVILNTCHIREKAAEKMYSDLGRVRMEKIAQAQAGKRMLIAVAGCVAQAEGEEIIARAPYVDMVVGPQSYHSLPDLIAETERTRKSQVNLQFVEEQKFDLLPETLQKQGASAFVSIQEGCDKFCTFCVVPYTRGAEYSRSVDAVLREVQAHVDQGAIEITLLGQNVNAYHGKWQGGAVKAPSPLGGEGWGEGALHGRKAEDGPLIPTFSPEGRRRAEDGEYTLAQLIREVAAIPGVKRIRYTTSHPRDMSDDLIRAHGEIETLMPFLHLPVQSGSDRILKAMNRKHTAADYVTIIEKLRAVRPDMAFSSDFIVGFPGETDTEFEDTLKLAEMVGFASAYTFKYSPRPGTPAADKAEQVDAAVMDERLQRLMATVAQSQLRFNKSKIGTTQSVLIDRAGRKPGQMMGRSPFMQSVVLENAVHYGGQLVDVHITEAYDFSLKGEVTARLSGKAA